MEFSTFVAKVMCFLATMFQILARTLNGTLLLDPLGFPSHNHLTVELKSVQEDIKQICKAFQGDLEHKHLKLHLKILGD